ncbi:EF-P lysine aminoacylase EpmA [Geobacter anodireducens]|uniref:EF-P lysine aminoacylase GenX n=1 Tax=Geobacter anodireducens TaxID=1340425 RepID=A0ABR9NXD0_9BACT|nr:EF-P lysine aminoacylase EpmA [Geobacter anodireducens]MBE2888912.1 EF-P lysine aminoacylase GenX [Geobacter anodireducens]HMN01581.1 EF-P lysine aminoacylase EpmA [Geobacter anodireducens]
MTGNWNLARRRSALWARARILAGIRRFFTEGGYLEVETPLRIPAPAPESHIDPVSSGPWFLQTSPELCMKRLVAAGYERVFQISRCWRDGERGSMHLPEFTMLEWYRAGTDYQGLMDECEELVGAVAAALGIGEVLNVRGKDIRLGAPWERLSVAEAFERYCDRTMEEALASDTFDECMVNDIEPRLGFATPTFICDYPADRGALARMKQDEPSLAERFELYIAGVELANAFSELTDPVEQRSRFEQEKRFRESRGKSVIPLPEPFLAELRHLPPTAGIALGIDRLVMLLLNVESIDDVVAFTPEEL